MPRPTIAAALAVFLLVCGLWSAPAAASGDFGCSPAWRLRQAGFTGCDSMMMLSPGNDTRVNLVLLLSRGGAGRAAPAVPLPDPLFDWPTFAAWTFPKAPQVGDATYAEGEGSRCLSDADGRVAFAAAVGSATRIGAEEKATLIAARNALRPTCVGSPAVAMTAPRVKSATGRDFATYLHGAAAFYAGDFDAAAARFAALGRSDQPWLRETARYMAGRVEVNRAQLNAFDEYGYRDEARAADRAAIDAAERGLREYLRAYPDGRYAISARGLLRRVYWLARDPAKLAGEYVALLARPADQRGIDTPELAEEIDDKLLPQLTPATTTDPVLLAVLDLRAMRQGDWEGADKPTITRAQLEAQRAHFAREPALFELLVATYAFYIENRATEVRRTIPDAARADAFDTIAFSRQMLRGMALDAAGDANARGFWIELLRGATPPVQRATVELALALHDERAGNVARVFAAGSPVGQATMREILLTNIADAALLRRQAGDPATGARERAVALFTLLYKELTRGAYRDFLRDAAMLRAGDRETVNRWNFVGGGEPPLGLFDKGLIREDFPCPALRETAALLARAPQSTSARLCLADWVRLNGLDGYFIDTQPPTDQLGGTTSHFPGKPFARLDVYTSVIAARGATADERAYALFRAVNCYAPSRNNQCGGAGVAPAQRRAWFERLHREFAASRWAEELKYYW